MSFLGDDEYIKKKADEIQRLLDVYKKQDEIKTRAYTVLKGEAQDIKRELSRLKRVMGKGMKCEHDEKEQVWICRLPKRV